MSSVLNSCRSRQHGKLLTSVFSATLRWLDSTPQGRLISRFTRDIRTIDGELTQMTSQVLEVLFLLLLRLAAIAYILPLFSLSGILLAAISAIVAQLCERFLDLLLCSPAERLSTQTHTLFFLSSASSRMLSRRSSATSETHFQESFRFALTDLRTSTATKPSSNKTNTHVVTESSLERTDGVIVDSTLCEPFCTFEARIQG